MVDRVYRVINRKTNMRKILRSNRADCSSRVRRSDWPPVRSQSRCRSIGYGVSPPCRSHPATPEATKLILLQGSVSGKPPSHCLEAHNVSALAQGIPVSTGVTVCDPTTYTPQRTRSYSCPLSTLRRVAMLSFRTVLA